MCIRDSISTVNLDPSGGTTAVIVQGIRDVILVLEDGTQMPLSLGGYLDVGIIDTMKDLFVNFIGAVVFSAIGYFYVKGRGKGNFATRFIPRFQRRPAAQAGPPQPQDASAGETPE